MQPLPQTHIQISVQQALSEDIGNGDITAQLIPVDQYLRATILTREPMVVCGCDWVEAAFRQCDDNVQLHWQVAEGDRVSENTTLLQVEGPARALLTAERTALNFLQMLSGVATLTHTYVSRVAHTHCQILDTRKTLPGLRLAQKYAVACGGGTNHRIGLFDAFLVKENHTQACGSIAQAAQHARKIAPDRLLEVEVETLEELDAALAAGVDRIMLDNFDLSMMRTAVAHVAGRVPLEVSGNVNLDTVVSIAETGVNFISIGGLTKHIQAIDLSMRVSA